MKLVLTAVSTLFLAANHTIGMDMFADDQPEHTQEGFGAFVGLPEDVVLLMFDQIPSQALLNIATMNDEMFRMACTMQQQRIQTAQQSHVQITHILDLCRVPQRNIPAVLADLTKLTHNDIERLVHHLNQTGHPHVTAQSINSRLFSALYAYLKNYNPNQMLYGHNPELIHRYFSKFQECFRNLSQHDKNFRLAQYQEIKEMYEKK